MNALIITQIVIASATLASALLAPYAAYRKTKMEIKATFRLAKGHDWLDLLKVKVADFTAKSIAFRLWIDVARGGIRSEAEIEETRYVVQSFESLVRVSQEIEFMLDSPKVPHLAVSEKLEAMLVLAISNAPKTEYERFGTLAGEATQVMKKLIKIESEQIANGL